MSRKYNSPYDLDLLTGELKKRREQENNQSGWTMQRFDGRTMYIPRSYPTGGSPAGLPFKSNQIKNIKKMIKSFFDGF